MISVLFLIPTLDRGGAENVLVDLVNHMDQSKFQITVQTLFDKDSQKDRLREGIEYRSFLYHQFHGNSRLFARIPAGLLYRLIVRKRYDVVVSYLEGPTAHIIAGCPYRDSKKVGWIHVEMKKERQLSVGFSSMGSALQAYQRYGRLVFVAETVKNSFEGIAGKHFSNACVLYNTIDSSAIKSKAKANNPKAVFSKDEFNIVSVGRIIDAKGFDRLAHVQKQLRSSGYHTHVYILGAGPDMEKISSYIEEQGISDVFTFLGFHKNPYPFVAGADLFVCSSRREGFSTAVTEALVLGIPVVSTNCSGTYELLGKNDEYGIVTENNEKAIFEGIKSVLDDPERLTHYREMAVKRGEAFETSQTVEAVENMISELAGNNEWIA